MDTKKLRQKILDLAIHGKLVPQDPNDEPASVLLERIRVEKERLISEGKIKRSRKTVKTSDTHHYEQDVPNGWCISTIGNVFTLQAGKNITANHISSSKNNKTAYPCFGGNGLRGYVNDFNRQGNYPIIGRQGALCGNINLAQGNFYATEHAVTVERYCNVDLMWVFYALIYLNLNQYATATAQPGLSVNVINEIPIAVPPLNEQLRISKQITTWFSIIDAIEQSKEDLQTAIKQAKSKILNLAIHGKLVSQDPNDEPASELLKRINPKTQITCDNGHSRKLPSNWLFTKIKNVFKINPRTQADDDMDVAFVPMVNISEGFRSLFTYEIRKWSSVKSGYTHFQNGDIAVAKISPCLENRKSVVFNSLPNGLGAGSTELHVFRSLGIETFYALYFFKSDCFLKQCIGTFNGVVGQQRAGKAIIENINFPLPPISEQKRIVRKIEDLFTLINTIEMELDE